MVKASAPVEDTARGLLAELMNEIIKKENLPFERVDVQWEINSPSATKLISKGQRKKRWFADIIIWEKFLTKPACIIEFKPPNTGWTPYTPDLIDDAENKAFKISPQSKYFGTWNTTRLAIFKTFEEEASSIVERRQGTFQICEVKHLEQIWNPSVKEEIKRNLRDFLIEFSNIYEEKKELNKLPPDSFFIYVIRSYVESTFYEISKCVKEEYKQNSIFKDKFIEWFVEQGWLPPQNDDDFERASRQYSYLLVDKILFYYLLKSNKYKLQDINLPANLKDPMIFKSSIQSYFNSALKATGDFEPIFAVNFIEKLPLPKDIIPSLVFFVNGFSRYDVSKISYADIGHLYDNLIPENERHIMGQYFTESLVVDLINRFCITRPEQVVADFGCGVGTFLVRAYALKKHLTKGAEHIGILQTLYGVDVSKFASHLSAINLTIRDLSSAMNYPQVANSDFFKLKFGEQFPIGVPTFNLDGEPPINRFTDFDRVDVVIGNPPYTREQEIEERSFEGYKRSIIRIIKQEWENKYKLPLKSSIYVHFFYHAIKFLKNGGRLGYVTSNSWLDANYGNALKEFLLGETKILTVIESRIEKWFSDPEVNTIITVVEKCSNKKERDSNEVAFVSIKKPLNEIIGEGDFDAIHSFVSRILEAKDRTSDDIMRVIKIRQENLYLRSDDDENKD